MRKYFLSLVAMATMILFSGCNKNEDFYISENGDMVTFNIATPEMGTRAISDGTTATNLTVAVYNSDTKAYLPGLTQELTINKTATVQLPLVAGITYDIVFWAEAADSPYTFDAAKGIVSVDYDHVTATANNENLDAFYANRLGYEVMGQKTETVELTRPFAQLNVATLDYEQAERSDIDITKTDIEVDGVYTSFNLLNEYGAVIGEPSDEIKLAFETIPTETLVVNGVSYKWLSMNYLLVNDKTNIRAKMTTKNENDDVTLTREWHNIPVQRNYRTNIVGNILTTTTDFNVVIDERFAGEEVYPDTDIENLYNAASNGGEVTLTGPVTLTAPLIIKKYVKLNLGGQTITGGKDYEQGITGIDIAAITVDGGNLIIEGEGSIIGSEYGVYAKNGGTLTIKGGELIGKTSAIQIAEANVNIEGGKFRNTNESDRRYVINCLDANWKNNTAKVNITGGSFYMFDPSNNEAEGAGTNFLTNEYSSLPNGDWFDVVIGASSKQQLLDLLSDPNISEINLASNIDMGSGDAGRAIEIDRDLIFNMNNKELKVKTTKANYFAYGFFVRVPKNVVFNDAKINGDGMYIAYGANVVYNGGEYFLSASETSRYTFYVATDNQLTTLTINGGEFSIDLVNRPRASYICSYGNSIVYINGGNFGLPGDYKPFVISNGGQIILSGGTFKFNPITYGATLAEGYVISENAGVWTVVRK